jgi:hypothetical protein
MARSHKRPDGRPKPEILIEVTDRRYRAVEICRGDGVFAVTYQGKPINVRRVNRLLDGDLKYSRSVFVLSGHAFSLARKLNRLFGGNDFQVMKMTMGYFVEEDHGGAGHDDLGPNEQ